MPEGRLTPAQYEIMEVVWDAGRTGASVADVWQAVSSRRSLARTTILNLVDRLEKRGWLKRREQDGANRYVAAVTRDRTNAALASGFVQEFFGGSASNLVMSLLGTEQLDAGEIQRLRRLLAEAAPKSSRSEGRP
jgi:predicted transcriptional regulator